MKDVFSVLVCLTILIFMIRYIFQVARHQISPTLSTWIIFFSGTALSLATYAIAEHRDFRSGILNLADFISTTSVLVTVIICGKREMRFRPFEKWYLLGVFLIIAYGLISRDAWSSNLFTQALISLGYLPMIHTLVSGRKNTESFTAWGLGVLAGIFGLYPAIVGGNTLAVVYAVRTISMIGIVIVLMFSCEIKQRKRG